MITAPKRHWFRPRYSLTTLFVVVTVCCVGVWTWTQLRWIADRREFLATDNVHEVHGTGGTPPDRAAPWSLRIFSERGLRAIEIEPDHDPNGELLKKSKRLFPEADVITFDLDTGIVSERR